MLGVLLANLPYDAADGVHSAQLALQGRLDGVLGGGGPVAAVAHGLQHLVPALKGHQVGQVLEGGAREGGVLCHYSFVKSSTFFPLICRKSANRKWRVTDRLSLALTDAVVTSGKLTQHTQTLAFSHQPATSIKMVNC